MLSDEQRKWIDDARQYDASLKDCCIDGHSAYVNQRRLLSIIDYLVKEKPIVEVCVADPTAPLFICGWWGSLCNELYEELEKNLNYSAHDFMEGLPKNTATVMCEIEYFPGQYGDYGRCEIEPYNLLNHMQPLQLTFFDSSKDNELFINNDDLFF